MWSIGKMSMSSSPPCIYILTRRLLSLILGFLVHDLNLHWPCDLALISRTGAKVTHKNLKRNLGLFSQACSLTFLGTQAPCEQAQARLPMSKRACRERVQTSLRLAISKQLVLPTHLAWMQKHEWAWETWTEPSPYQKNHQQAPPKLPTYKIMSQTNGCCWSH